MKTIFYTACVVLIAGLVVGPYVIADEPAAEPAHRRTGMDNRPPEIPQTPAAVDELIYARTFTLDKSYKFFWSKERQNVTTGTVLVLKVKDKNLVYPRSVAMPVLYVGDRTAERINQGHTTGVIIAIVPGEIDLAKAPIWFGSPDLPPMVDSNKAQAERANADAAKIVPFKKEMIDAANAKGGEAIHLADVRALLREVVAPLIDEYAPTEAHLAESCRRVPLKKQPPPASSTSED